MTTKKPRLNTKLESSGAEFLVLGLMLIDGIQCHKTYTNNPDYDLVAVEPSRHRSARIQVKSRYATDFDGGFLVEKYNCDFIVFALLNRGFLYSKKHKAASTVDGGRRAPDIYVFPASLVSDARYAKSPWGKTFLKDIPNFGDFKDNWNVVRDFLKSEQAGVITP